MPKYTTLKELSAAFKSGELDSTYYLVMDKGGNDLVLCQNGPEETEEECTKRFERCKALFVWDCGNPVQELLAMAGIPSERC